MSRMVARQHRRRVDAEEGCQVSFCVRTERRKPTPISCPGHRPAVWHAARNRHRRGVSRQPAAGFVTGTNFVIDGGLTQRVHGRAARGLGTKWPQEPCLRSWATGAPWEEIFARYVWYKDGDKVFEGRLVKRSSGSYQGYLLDSREWPKDIEELYVHS